MRGAISTETASEADVMALVEKVKEQPTMAGAALALTVGTTARYDFPLPVGVARKGRVAGIDYGIKRNILMPGRLAPGNGYCHGAHVGPPPRHAQHHVVALREGNQGHGVAPLPDLAARQRPLGPIPILSQTAPLGEKHFSGN